ncbi:MAG TPA: carboxyl transferase domain-containing protein [Thermoleophilaceae bacterium]|jgi:acetyl-CoA carboxylase carboxyltransferase component
MSVATSRAGLEPLAPGIQRPPPLGPRERIELLCDPGSVQVIRSTVESRRIGARAQPGDGVVAAAAAVDGRPVFCFAQDGCFVGGSLGEAHAETIVRVLSLARDARVPVVSFVESAGARVQEATAALGGYGRIFRETVALSHHVPQISIISGTSAGGGSYAPALTDFIVMTRDATMFLTGPGVVRAATGESVGAAELGGAAVHSRNGVCQFVAPTEADAAVLTRELLSYLPQNTSEAPPGAEPREPLDDNPGAHVPRETRKVYDVRDVARAIVDGGRLLEVAPRWARNVVTAFARIDGRSIGIVANQPRHLGGVLDSAASRKAARFVSTCDRFNVPLVVLVDTPGFLPGTRQERSGVIWHGSELLRAFGGASVLRLTVVLRQAYGGAYITMNSKDLGADYAFAWPRARVGIMAAAHAVGIINRREIAAAPDPVARQLELSERYAAEHLSAHAVAREGFVDEVIAPHETRARLAAALRTFGGKRP